MRYTDDGILKLGRDDLDDGTSEINGVSYLLEHLNDILREEQLKWQVVYGVPNEMFSHVEGSVYRNGLSHSDTHVSRLMPPRRIQKDTAESLLRELASCIATSALSKDGLELEYSAQVNNKEKIREVLDRARKLLEGEKK